MVGREELDNPVFDDGFAVAAGDADDGDGELRTAVGGQALQGGDHVVDHPVVGIGMTQFASLGHHEVAHATRIQVVDILAAAGVALGRDGEKEGGGRRREASAVGKQMEYITLGQNNLSRERLYDGGYLLGFHEVCFIMWWPMRQSRQRRLSQ